MAPGQTVAFQGATEAGTTLTWTFGDGGTASTLAATHAFGSVGTYTVSFKAAASGYTASTARVTVTVIAKPSITSFTASPGSITSGQSSTLAWAVTGADGLSLNQGIGTVTGTSYSVTPAVSTTYTLTATNAAGSVTATVTVAVSAPAPPTIVSFTASPSTIAVGHSTTLAWNVTGGASVSISGLGSQSGTSVSVSPATTTSYILTATNAAGTATATITVRVEAQLPTITDFWADPYQVASGQSTTLNWAVSQADTVKLNGTTRTGASASVAPTATTTYTLTATNLLGSVSATLTVNVGAPGALVWTKTIVYGFGQELAEDQPGMGTTFIQSDFVGSPSFMTGADGALIGRSKNLPFGERMSSWGQKTIRRYTNHEDDPDSGAIYMQAREQLPAYGKFAQVDPAYDQTKDDPESWNLYNYVTNNPVTHTDPDGRINVELGNASLPSQHHFDFDTDTFDGDLNWAAFEPTAGSSGSSGAKKDEAKEAQEGSSSTDTNSGDQGKDDTKDDTTSTKPDKPKEATAPKTETKPAQTTQKFAETDAKGNPIYYNLAHPYSADVKVKGKDGKMHTERHTVSRLSGHDLNVLTAIVVAEVRSNASDNGVNATVDSLANRLMNSGFGKPATISAILNASGQFPESTKDRVESYLAGHIGKGFIPIWDRTHASVERLMSNGPIFSTDSWRQDRAGPDKYGPHAAVCISFDGNYYYQGN